MLSARAFASAESATAAKNYMSPRIRTLAVVLLLGLADAKKKKKAKAAVEKVSFSGCQFNLEPYSKFETPEYFWCDKKQRFLNGVSTPDSSEYVMAAPARSKGCHEYAAHEGPAPEGCTVGKTCAACANPAGKHIRSEYFETTDSGGCSGMCGVGRRTPDRPPPPPPDDDDEDEDAHLWGRAAKKPTGHKFTLEDGWVERHEGDEVYKPKNAVSKQDKKKKKKKKANKKMKDEM